MALVLGGSMAAPAEARPRGAAVDAANAFIGSCFIAGGNAYVYEENNVISTLCSFEDGGGVVSHEVYD